MKITGAIFDMDGTLVDSLMIWDVLWERLGEKYRNDRSFRPDPETERAVRTLPLREAMELLHKESGIGEDGETLWRIADDLCREFYARDVLLKDGVPEFLEHLRVNGVRMCVASATAPTLLQIVIDRYRLDRYFSKIFSCSEIGRGKEFPDVFQAAHAYLGTEQESTWVFEDSFVALQTARRAGYQTVGIYDRFNFYAEQMPSVSTEYVAKGETLCRLIPSIAAEKTE